MYVRVPMAALGAVDETEGAVDPLVLIQSRLDEVIRRQREEEKNRRLALIIAGAGALFAAARLGIIALPLIRRERE